MVASGVPRLRPDHAQAIVKLALDIQAYILSHTFHVGRPINFRIGVNSGPVLAGVIGRKKFIYDLWGDAVNTAYRMQEYGLPDHIQVTAATHDYLRDKYVLEKRGTILVKRKSEMVTYFLTGRRE